MDLAAEPTSGDDAPSPGAHEPDATTPVTVKEGAPSETTGHHGNSPGAWEWLRNHPGKIIALIPLVVALVGGGWRFTRPREFMTTAALEQEIGAEVEGTGTVTAKVMANVGSKINGRIERMLVEEGDVVEKDQIVAVLEDTDLRRQVDLARAQLELARATEWAAKREGTRGKALLGTQVISAEDADRREASQLVAEKAVQARQAELAYGEFKLSETKVATLVSGLVTKRWVEAGNTVVAGQPVLAVAETSLIVVNTNVDQRFSAQVRKGQSATVILRGRTAQPFPGYVFRVYPQADAVTEEMLVQVAFPLPPAEFQFGQWAEVFIEVTQKGKFLVVPKDAVMIEGGDRFIFVAGSEGRARRVKVELGATSPRLPVVAVTGDLNSGEQVISMPMGLKGGERVRAKTSPGRSPPGKPSMPPEMKM